VTDGAKHCLRSPAGDDRSDNQYGDRRREARNEADGPNPDHIGKMIEMLRVKRLIHEGPSMKDEPGQRALHPSPPVSS